MDKASDVKRTLTGLTLLHDDIGRQLETRALTVTHKSLT